MTSKSRKSNRSVHQNFNIYIRNMWLIALGILLSGGAFLIYIIFSKLPDISQLENPKYEYASTAYDVNMKELAKIFKYNRTWVTFEQIPEHTVNALLATEDIRFYRHNGIDLRGTLRALLYLGKKGGASTISQQLSKLFFTEKSDVFIIRVYQKMQEWVLAIELERRYTKQEIIAMYLNKYDFWYNSHGIEAAAHTYFGKPQSRLSPDEAAVLIGMLKHPYLFNPKLNPVNAGKRRNVVLGQMKKYGFLDEETHKKLTSQEFRLKTFNPATHFTGVAPYFRAELIQWLQELLDKREYRKPDGSRYNPFVDGLKIYTTIDLDYQVKAEEAVRSHMRSLQSSYDNLWAGRDPWTFEAEGDMLKIRNASLNAQIRSSERFTTIRNEIMSGLIDSIQLEFPDSRLEDVDIQRLIKGNKNNEYFDQLIERNIATNAQVRFYKSILSSRFWPLVVERQRMLNAAVKRSFNKKVNMKVFDYNGGERIALMTPIDSIKYHRSRLQTGVLAIEPKTGFIKAWVGGIDYKYFKYDHIRSKRQVGSTFKPFVYTTAIFNQGISPCFKILDQQYSITPGESNFGLMQTWSPSNSTGKFTGSYISLKDGLLHSVNSLSVYLMKELGSVDIVRDMVEKFGISKSLIPRSPSICLGSADISVMDMTAAYAVFANQGVYNEPIFVTRIEDKNGKLIYQATQDQRRVLSEDYNYVMVDMLLHAGERADAQLVSQAGGKTGTTNNYRDGWFMGITPEVVVGVWTGGEDQWIRFLSIEQGQGSVMARPIFINFIRGLESDRTINYNPNAKFPPPKDGMKIVIDCEEYERNHGQNTPGSANKDVRLEEGFDEEI